MRPAVILSDRDVVEWIKPSDPGALIRRQGRIGKDRWSLGRGYYEPPHYWPVYVEINATPLEEATLRQLAAEGKIRLFEKRERDGFYRRLQGVKQRAAQPHS